MTEQQRSDAAAESARLAQWAMSHLRVRATLDLEGVEDDAANYYNHVLTIRLEVLQDSLVVTSGEPWVVVSEEVVRIPR